MDDPIAEARRVLAAVEAETASLDFVADGEEDGAMLWGVEVRDSDPYAHAICYATSKAKADFITASPRLLQALIDRLEAAEAGLRDIGSRPILREVDPYTEIENLQLKALATLDGAE